MRKEFKIGIFAVIVIVASFFVLNYLKGEDIFNKEAEYVAVYENTEGLVVSAPVYVKGYKAGKVSDVSYDSGSGRFSVVCSVSKQFAVPEDSQMTIYGVDIMGGKGVRIDLGTSRIMAQDGDTLAANYEPGLMDSIASEIGPLMKIVGQTLDSLQITVNGVNRMFTQQNIESVRRTFYHVESLVADLSSLSSDINGRSDDITAMIGNLKSFSDSLQGIAVKADSTLGQIDCAVRSVNAADLTGTIESLKKLLDNVNDPDGSLAKLFVDDSIYNSVDSLLINIDRFVDKIQENPKKYLKISVF